MPVSKTVPKYQSGRLDGSVLIQEMAARKQMQAQTDYLKEELYSIIDCGNGYWFFGYLDFGRMGMGCLDIKSELVDITYKAVTSISPESFAYPLSLQKFFDCRDRYKKSAYRLLQELDTKLDFEREVDSEEKFQEYLNVQNVKVDKSAFDLKS
jgi:hypothetical protein